MLEEQKITPERLLSLGFVDKSTEILKNHFIYDLGPLEMEADLKDNGTTMITIDNGEGGWITVAGFRELRQVNKLIEALLGL